MTNLARQIPDCNNFPRSFLDPDTEREATRAFRVLASRLEAGAERHRHATDLRSQEKERKPAFAAEASREYHRDRGDAIGVVSRHSGAARNRDAPEVTVDAVMWRLREQGTEALRAPSCQLRLRELSIGQLENVLARLVALRPQYPKITDELLSRIAKGIARKRGKGEGA